MRGSVVKNAICLEKMYSKNETTCFGLYWPSSFLNKLCSWLHPLSIITHTQREWHILKLSTQSITIIPDNHILKILHICEPQVSRLTTSLLNRPSACTLQKFTPPPPKKNHLLICGENEPISAYLNKCNYLLSTRKHKKHYGSDYYLQKVVSNA